MIEFIPVTNGLNPALLINPVIWEKTAVRKNDYFAAYFSLW